MATGVQCESGKDVINVNAKAVLVCTGGYLANEEKVAAEYGGCKVVNMGSLNNTGDGERIVLAAGGEATLHEKRYYAIFSENTVNAMKDSPYYQSIGAPAVWTSAATMLSAPLANFDANLASAQEEGWCFKASSIAELAEVTGLETLPETVTEYDSYVAAGADPDFLKDPAFLQPIEDGSTAYYAFEYNPSAFNTFGGPRTDEQCRALDANSDPIPGLYVAGVENGSLFCSPYYAVGGSCSGLSQASGRVAAKAMVEYIANA